MGPERLCLWDSKQRGGRPDVMKLVKEAHAYWKAEGVLLLNIQYFLFRLTMHDQWFSSHPTTREIRRLCKAAKKWGFQRSVLSGTSRAAPSALTE
jgi:hypothetical protein